MKNILLFCVLAFTACIQCSKPKKERATQAQDNTQTEKTIKTIIVSAIYFPEPTQIGNRHYQEYFQWLYEARCYKKLTYYSDPYTPYKGDIVDGELLARVYKKDGSFLEIPLMTLKEEANLLRSQLQNRPSINLHTDLLMSYSGKEVRLEVRRVNKDKKEDVLLYEREIGDLTGSWEEAESWINMPNGGGFRKESQCHRSSGVM